MTEPTCDNTGCRTAVTHAESYNRRMRYWCEKHTPWSGHYEYCPDPCSRLMQENTTEVSAGQMDLLQRMSEEEPAIRALLTSFALRNARIKTLEGLADDLQKQRDVYRNEATAAFGAEQLRNAEDRRKQREQREGFWDGRKCGHFIVIRDYDKLVRLTDDACKTTGVEGGLAAEGRVNALVVEIKRLRLACLDTVHDGDLARQLKATCERVGVGEHRLTAMGNVEALGLEIERLRDVARLSEPDRAPLCSHERDGKMLSVLVDDGATGSGRVYVSVAVCKFCQALYYVPETRLTFK